MCVCVCYVILITWIVDGLLMAMAYIGLLQGIDWLLMDYGNGFEELKRVISTTWYPKPGIWMGPSGIQMKFHGGNSITTFMVSTSHELIISPTAGKASAPLCLHAMRQRQIPKQHHPAALQEARHFGLPDQLQTARNSWKGTRTRSACFQRCTCKCLAAVWSAHPPNCEIWSPHSHILHGSWFEAQLKAVEVATLW